MAEKFAIFEHKCTLFTNRASVSPRFETSISRVSFFTAMLISDFVEDELGESQIRVLGAEIAPLTKDEEWTFFADLRKRKRGLGAGELGAITVAISRIFSNISHSTVLTLQPLASSSGWNRILSILYAL
jgi:hypothetical protein